MIISVTNQKGGVGKSTSTQTIGSILTDKGYKVLLIDADSQANLSYSCNIDFQADNLTIYEVLKGEADISKAIQEKANYDIIPSHLMLDNIVNELDPGNSNDLIRFRNVLKPIKDRYDFILVDTGPSLDILNINVFIASDFVIIPTEPSSYALQGITKLLNTVKNIKRANKGLKVLGVFLVKYKHWTKGHQETREMLNDFLSSVQIKLFNTYISDSVVISNSQGNRQDLIDYDKNSKVFKEYEDLSSELLKELKRYEQEKNKS